MGNTLRPSKKLGLTNSLPFWESVSRKFCSFLAFFSLFIHSPWMGKTSLTLQWTSNTSHSIISMSWDHGFLHSVKDYSSINSLINLAVFTRNFHQQIPKKERRRRKLFSFKQSRIHKWDWCSCTWNWPFFKAHHSVYFLLLVRNRSNVLSIFARRSLLSLLSNRALGLKSTYVV